MFDVFEGAQGSIPSAHNFEPAHQEGLEALCILGDSVYSSARDHCIRRWDLSSKQLKQVREGVRDFTSKTMYCPAVLNSLNLKLRNVYIYYAKLSYISYIWYIFSPFFCG